MITICTALWEPNEKSYAFSRCYNEEWVKRLYDGCKRNITGEFNFALFTDIEREIDRPVDQHIINATDYGSFVECLNIPGPKIVMGLDTVITGNIDHLCQWAEKGKDLLLPRDPYHPEKACNGVSVVPGHLDMFTGWDGENDMDWFRSFPHKYLDDVFPGDVVSYKGHVAEHGLGDAKIVYFHGTPKMHELPGTWVDDHWGEPVLYRMEYIEKLNASMDSMLLNTKKNLGKAPLFKPEPENNRTAMIVGGGPSLNDTLGLLQKRRNAKTDIFTLNATHDYLMERGIKPDYHVMLDSRKENVSFVKNPIETRYLIASQCHPDVFKALEGQDVTMWIADLPGMRDIVKEETIFVCGGSTVGLKTLYLAYLMGYRKFDIYGFDSCYREGENHAYPQPLNDGEEVREVFAAGRKFMVAPWMAKQAEHFQQQAKELYSRGCDILVNGDGLITHMIREGNKRANQA